MIMNLLRQAQHALGEQGGRMTRLDLIDVEQCSHDISDQADAMIDAIEAATEEPPPPPPEGGAMKARAVRQCRAVKATTSQGTRTSTTRRQSTIGDDASVSRYLLDISRRLVLGRGARG
jgi:hypothetical protein